MWQKVAKFNGAEYFRKALYVQVSPEMFSQVQVWALAEPLKDIQRLVLKPLLCCLGCVLRVVVLLEGESSPQSEVLSSLE